MVIMEIPAQAPSDFPQLPLWLEAALVLEA
jgi:hypothetical protein